MNDLSHVAELSEKPFWTRMRGYWAMSGPGYMQSAMTLGGGSVASCVLMGSLLGYDLLWVQPLAITLGYFILASVAKQTTATQEKPYDVFWRHLHPAIAILWAVSALIATILWHIPQYSLTANGVVVLAEGIGLNLDTTARRWGIGAVALTCAIGVVYLYEIGARGLRYYERAVKALVWSIVIAFAVVAIASGFNPVRFLLGITGIGFLMRFEIFGGAGIPPEAIKPIVGGIAAAVGINMVFLYPYSLLKKNWGPQHKELAYFDLVTGMVVPFVLATGLMIVAVANTIGPAPGEAGVSVRDIRGIIPVLSDTIPGGLARLILGLGMAAIGFSTIITHMLANGFIGCELFNKPMNSPWRWVFTLLPAIGVVGVALPFPWYAAVTASTLAAPLMPIAVVGFILLLNNRDYLGKEAPTGLAKLGWNAILSLAVLVLCVAAYFGLRSNWEELKKQLAAPSVGNVAVAPPAPTVSAASTEPAVRVHRTHRAMGTEFGITIFGPPNADPAALNDAAEAAFAAVDALEASISNWRADSNVSAINRGAALGPVAADANVWQLLRASEEIYRDTGGAFDPSVSPLLRAWGFYDGAVAPPSEEQYAAAMASVGFDKVTLDRVTQTVKFAREGMALDFGGIGKGQALDRAAAVLKEQGIENALLHGGESSILAMGAPPGAAAWTVEVGSAYTGREQGVVQVQLRNESLSTSAAYDHLPQPGETAHSHIFDPRSGRPVDTWLSASAIAPSGRTSDGLSTAFYVLDLMTTQAYCERHPDTRAVLVELAGAEPRAIFVNFDE